MTKFDIIFQDMNKINTISRTGNTIETNKQQENSDISQHDLMRSIHNEFSKTFIKKLYFNPEWTDRVFWAVVGTIQLTYDNIVLDRILQNVIHYLIEHKMPKPNNTHMNTMGWKL